MDHKQQDILSHVAAAVGAFILGAITAAIGFILGDRRRAQRGGNVNSSITSDTLIPVPVPETGPVLELQNDSPVVREGDLEHQPVPTSVLDTASLEIVEEDNIPNNGSFSPARANTITQEGVSTSAVESQEGRDALPVVGNYTAKVASQSTSRSSSKNSNAPSLP